MKDTQDRKSWQQPSQPLFVVVENDDNEPNQTKPNERRMELQQQKPQKRIDQTASFLLSFPDSFRLFFFFFGSWITRPVHDTNKIGGKLVSRLSLVFQIYMCTHKTTTTIPMYRQAQDDRLDRITHVQTEGWKRMDRQKERQRRK